MEIWVFLVIAAVVSGIAFLFWYFSAEQRSRRRLKSMVTVPIAEATEGDLVKVAGTVTLESQIGLSAPLSHRGCVAYVVTVDERRGSGKNRRWVEVLRDQESVDFVLEDDTGRALVQPHGSQLLLVRDAHASSGTFNDADPHLVSYLAEHGLSTEGFLGLNKGMRYKEGVLEVGEHVAVLGKARWEMDPDPQRSEGYRGRAKRLVIDMDDDGTLLISDDTALLGG